MKGKIAIDKELCKGCTYCVMTCPKGVIVMDTQFNTMGYFTASSKNPDNCTGCGLCAQMCPEIAIKVWSSNNKSSKQKKA